MMMTPLSRSLLILVLASLLMGGGDSYPDTPEEVVSQHLSALKAYDFPRAYLYLSDEMNAGKDAWNWSMEQKQIYEYAEVEIYGFEIYEAVIEGEKAFVPNILKSRDKFLNKLGVDEYELYVLHKKNGDWVIDRQKLVTKAKQDQWFKQPYQK
jgi:hypothetical protein